MWPSEWPSSARAIAIAVDAAVHAARAADEPAFTEAIAELAELPADQVGAVLAAIVRELLEVAHPDGLTGDDVRAVLEAVVRATVPWHPRLDVAAVIATLTGALGVDDATEPDAPPADVHPAAVLLIAHLTERTGVRAGDTIGRAIGEIARAETVEMP
ncbi:hypothetical protein [Nocardia sp. NPDC050717]|uniref:hypothetical protein n=1 Tax=Nocardia sp. NPDC050717 TaxID=3157221 RepID=UPI0033D483BA